MLRIALNFSILGLWVWLFRPVYGYLATIFTRQEFRTNQVVLVAVLALVAMQLRRGQFQLKLDVLPQLYPPALAMALGSAALFVLAEAKLDINTLSASLFGLATYGLLGLWLRPLYWWQGMPAALLLIGALPFGEHMETFIGYPVRLVTARIVGEGLAALGAPNLGVETILVFENGMSQVDNPCSGVKSLWTGALFLLAATWIERRRLDKRWVLTAILFAFLLLAANLVRVAVLVAVGQVLGWRLFAEMLHVPLGVIGFVAACAAGLALLRWSHKPAEEADFPETNQALPAPARPTWFAALLSFALIFLALFYSPTPEQASAASLEWRLPDELNARAWPLSPNELAWLSTDGAVSARRFRINWRGQQGSLLLVASQDWRAQHRPERCFTVYGLEIQSSQPGLAGADFPLRLLSLGTPGGETLYSAAYWLQSSSLITEDYAARIWDDLAPQPEPWVLVTVLFDQPVDAQSPAAKALFIAIRDTAQANLSHAAQP
jgi:exosortase O